MTSEALSSNPSLDSSTHSGGLNISTDIVLGTLFPTINTTTTTTTTTNLPVTPRLSTSSINSDGTHTTSSMNLFTSTVGGVKTTNYEVTSLKFHSTDRVNKSHASTLSTKLMTSSINTISAYKTSTDMTVPFISNSAKFSHETSTPHPTKQNIADVSLISSVTDEIRDTSTISSSLKTNFEKTTRITDEIRDTSTISSSPKTNFDKTTPITDEIRDTSTISSSLKTNFEKTTRITDEIRDTSTISSSPKTNFDKTTPITDEIRDTSTISSSPKTNFDKTTPITDEIRDTSTISSSPKTNFDKTTPITDEIRDTSTISSSPKTNFDKTTPITDEIRDTSTISSSLKTTFDKTTPINLDTEKNQLFSSLVTSSSTMMHTDITVQTKQNITKHTNYPVTPRKTSLFTQTNTSYESTQSTISFSPPINTSFSPSLLPDTTRPAKPNTTIATHRPATDQRNDVHIGTKESIKTTTTFRPTLSSDKTTHTVDSKTTTVPKWNVTRRVDMSLTVTGNTESAASSTLRQPVTSISSGSSDSSSSTLRQPVTSTSSGSNESPSSTLRQPVTSTSSGSNESPSSTLRQPVTSISSGSHESSSSQTSGTLPNGFTSSLNFTSSSAYTSPATETTVTPISSGSNESSSSQTSGTLPNGFTSSLNFTSSSAYTSPATGTSEQSTATLNGTTIRRKEQQTGIDEDTLSTAAIFGIAVGSLCVLALLGSVVYCSCRTRRSLHYSNPYSPSSNGGVNHMKNSSLANGNMKNGNVHIEYEKPGTSNGVLKTDNVFIYEMTTETMVHNENMSNGLDQSCSFNTRL